MQRLELDHDTDESRSHLDTSRGEHLNDSTAASTAPSAETTSADSHDGGECTPRAGSPAPSVYSEATSATLVSRRTSIATNSESYRGFPNEEAYLNALRAWIEEKKYIQPNEDSNTLSGWYGTKTMDDYIESSEKPLELSLFKRWRERKAERKEEKSNKRRASAAT